MLQSTDNVNTTRQVLKKAINWVLLGCSMWALCATGVGLPRSLTALATSSRCSGIPRTVPQLPLFLLEPKRDGTRQLRIGVLGTNGLYFSQSLNRILLVPTDGPVSVVPMTRKAVNNVHQESYGGKPISVLTIPIALSIPGEYRVVVEQKDVDAPPGCEISFFIAIGTIHR